MIGRLLQSAASTFTQHNSSRPQTPLESVTEEAHTRDLLYPDIYSSPRNTHQSGHTLHAARHLANAREAADYDDRGGLDVGFPADIRIIIAQDANPRYHQPQVLYDSKPTQISAAAGDGSPHLEFEGTSWQRDDPFSSKTRSSQAPTPTRRYHTPSSSIFQSPQTQMLMSPPLSSDSRLKNHPAEFKLRSSPFEPQSSHAESRQARLMREAKEESEALLGCMFGAPGFRIEPGTKLHVLPGKTMNELAKVVESSNAARPISSGGSVRKRTPLVRSTSAADFPHGGPVQNDSTDGLRANTRSSVMFTRLFAVNLSESSTADADHDPDRTMQLWESESDLPHLEQFEAAATQASKGVKQKKVPMYAVAVVLQLPVDGHHARLRTQTQQHALSSLGSSFNEITPAASWNTEHSMFCKYMDVRSSGSSLGTGTLVNGHLSNILSHWSLVSRTLEHFEVTARDTLITILEQAAPFAPLISAPPVRTGNSKPKKAKQPTQQSVHVLPGCLQANPSILKESDIGGQRIISALRTRRVATGQGRWGAWREEARWVGRWAGGRDQNFFFFNLLTAFLGHSTSWLETFGSYGLRHRYTTQKHSDHQRVSRMDHRTVIVSSDKMAARRLIFLLAAFLPGPHVPTYNIAPLSPYPAMLYSESPPSIATARDRSLRRSINTRPSVISKGNAAREGHARSVSFSLIGAVVPQETQEDLPLESPGRRTSDARSLGTSSLAISSGGESLRKASTSTVVEESAQPVPHFVHLPMQPAVAKAERQRPGSSGSLASMALTHTLRRSDSNAVSSSGSGGRWGSVVSGFWSNRRGSSTDESDAFGTSQEGSLEYRTLNGSRRPVPTGKLAQMVEEVSSLENSESMRNIPSVNDLVETTNVKNLPRSSFQSSQTNASAAKNIPRKPKAERIPLKMLLNEDDGYIDIEMPHTRSFTSSMESSFNSFRIPNHTSGSFYSPYGVPIRPDSPCNKPDPSVDVAGWLRSYQPDFALQAVRPYESLKDDVKHSMLAELPLVTIPLFDGWNAPNPEWTDICTTLIADTTKFSLQRLILRRRRLKISSAKGNPTLARAVSPGAVPRNPTNLAASEFEEEFIEEPIMDMDSTLIDAVERVLAQSSHSSRVHSRAPSPSAAGNARVGSRPGSVRGSTTLNNVMDPPSLEVPHNECRRMVLGALEEVVKSVIAEQQGYNNGGQEGARLVRGKEMQDSSLREGVRKWLLHSHQG